MERKFIFEGLNGGFQFTIVCVRTLCVFALSAAFVSCGSPSPPSNPVSSFLGSLPNAELSNTQNNSIVSTLDHLISNTVTPPNNWFLGNTITDEVRGLDPFYTYSVTHPYMTSITPTSISGGLQVNNGIYITNLTMLWKNVQNQLYNYGFQSNETDTLNGSFVERGNYSFVNGNASLYENGSLDTQFEIGDGSNGWREGNYAASSSAQGFTPNSLSFSINDFLHYNNSGVTNYSAASTLTDYTTGLKLQRENYNGWASTNYTEIGAPYSLTINMTGGIVHNGNASVLGMSVSNVTSRFGVAEVINMQIQFSTSTVINANGIFGEIDEGGSPWGLSFPVSPPLDFSGKVNFKFSNLTFVDSYCAGWVGGYWPWPTDGIISVISTHTYKYDFSINNSGKNCGCAVVSIDDVPLHNGLPDCTIGSSQPLNVYSAAFGT